MDTNNRWKDWLTGHAERSLYQRTMILLLMGLIGMFLISSALYPGGYSMAANSISDLGMARNTRGQWWFRIYFVVFGLLMIPQALYLDRSLQPDVKLISHFSVMFLIIAMVGMMGVGIFPADEPTHTLHITSAGIQICGTLLHILFSIHPLIKKWIEKRTWPNIGVALLLFLQIAIPSALAIIFVGVPIVHGDYSGYDAYWPMVEWSIFLCSFVWIGGMVLMVRPN